MQAKEKREEMHECLEEIAAEDIKKKKTARA
jgi:hypothetical protein